MKTESLARPEVEAFVQYILDNGIEIAEAAQFVPLTDEQLTKAKSRPREALGGVVGRDRDLTAGAEPRLRAKRRRYGEDVVKGVLAVCALISVATTVGIVIALFVPAFEFFQEISIVDFLTGTNWSPLFEPAQLRRPAAGLGHASRDRAREPRRDAARPRRRRST